MLPSILACAGRERCPRDDGLEPGIAVSQRLHPGQLISVLVRATLALDKDHGFDGDAATGGAARGPRGGEATAGVGEPGAPKSIGPRWSLWPP